MRKNKSHYANASKIGVDPSMTFYNYANEIYKDKKAENSKLKINYSNRRRSHFEMSSTNTSFVSSSRNKTSLIATFPKLKYHNNDIRIEDTR